MNYQKQAKMTLSIVNPATRYFRLALLAGTTSLLLGCMTTRSAIETTPEQEQAFLEDFPVSLHQEFLPALKQGPRNEVLHYMNAGTKAFELGEWQSATIAFDRVLQRIETIYADNEIAEKARSTFFAEEYKDFLGEPHERMMAYYYRGLLYIRGGDFENARASFRGGLLQDSFTADAKYAQDSALLHYLIGWSSKCIDDSSTAKEAFEEAKKHRHYLETPKDTESLLMLVELGQAPNKIRAGEYGETLKYSKNRSYIQHDANLVLANQTITTALIENLTDQAETHGKREIDTILEEQSDFKNFTDKTAELLLAGASSAMFLNTATALADNDNDAVAAVGLTLLATALIAKTVSDSVEAHADTRAWVNLPERIRYATHDSQTEINTGNYQIKYYNIANKKAASTIDAKHIFGPEHCQILWTTSQSRDYNIDEVSNGQ